MGCQVHAIEKAMTPFCRPGHICRSQITDVSALPDTQYICTCPQAACEQVHIQIYETSEF